MFIAVHTIINTFHFKYFLSAKTNIHSCTNLQNTDTQLHQLANTHTQLHQLAKNYTHRCTNLQKIHTQLHQLAKTHTQLHQLAKKHTPLYQLANFRTFCMLYLDRV